MWNGGASASPLPDVRLTVQEREGIAAAIRADINAYCETVYSDPEPRWHLGASLIGDECSARLWMLFRWFRQEQFGGRMERLFNRGHEMEPRFIGWLRGIGFEVSEFETPDGTQWRVKGSGGHFGGSLDGRLMFPARYLQLFEKLRHLPGFLLEMKTHNAKSFAAVAAKTVRLSKPKHFAQMSVYGRYYGFRYALYLAINKNDDDIYPEIVELDWEYAAELERKADDIITARRKPPMIAQTAAFFACKTCEFSGICHNGEKPDVNCRSCLHSRPIDGGEWFCELHNGVIPREFVKQGCHAHTPAR